MKLVGVGVLNDFTSRHTDVRAQVEAWIAEVKDATWRTPQDVKQRYRSASFLHDNRVILNFKGNKYRLDAKIAYDNQIVFVKRMGTHQEYEKWKF